jgi:hypothetical protein
MAYYYMNPADALDQYRLPDVEVFHTDHWPDGSDSETGCPPEDGQGVGFYYAFGTPGCLWDSDPIGPFDSDKAALAAARSDAQE